MGHGSCTMGHVSTYIWVSGSWVMGSQVVTHCLLCHLQLGVNVEQLHLLVEAARRGERDVAEVVRSGSYRRLRDFFLEQRHGGEGIRSGVVEFAEPGDAPQSLTCDRTCVFSHCDRTNSDCKAKDCILLILFRVYLIQTTKIHRTRKTDTLIHRQTDCKQESTVCWQRDHYLRETAPASL